MREILRLLESGQSREALQRARQRSDERPVRGLLPTLCFLNEERDEGLGWLRRLAAEDESPAQLARLARLAGQVGAFATARFCLEKAPEDPAVRAEKLHLARLQGRTRRAYRLVHEPEDRAALAAQLGRMKEALKLFSQVGGAYGHHQRAEIFLRRGDLEQADHELDLALQADPGYLWSRWRRAQQRALTGEWEGALAELDRIDPDFAQKVDLLRAAWLELQGRHRECEAIRRRYASPLVLRRLRELRGGTLCEWRQYAGREPLQRVATSVLGGVPMEAVQQFLEREFPLVNWEFRLRKGQIDFQTASWHVLHGNRTGLARALRVHIPREQQGLLVVTRGEAPWRAHRGFGGGRLAVVELDPQDRFVDSVLAHELGHSLLGLQHTDGLKFYEDAFSLQGYPGSMGPLELAYVDFRQKAAMITFPGRSERVEEAWEEERRGFPQRAYRAYREILARDPLDHWVRGRLARLALALGHRAEGLKRVRQLRRRDLNLELAAWQVEICLKHGQPVPPGFPDHDAGARLARGRARLRGLDYPGGEFDLWVSYGLAPESKEALLSLGSQALERGRHRRAERLLRACLKDCPVWGEAWRELALCSAEQGRYDEAEEQLARARGLQHESADQAWHEGQVAWLAGRYDEARQGFARARRWAPEQQVPCFSLGYWETCLGKQRTARDLLERARAIDPASFTGKAAAAWLARSPRMGSPLLKLVPRFAPLLHLAGRLERLRALEPNHPLFTS